MLTYFCVCVLFVLASRLIQSLTANLRLSSVLSLRRENDFYRFVIYVLKKKIMTCFPMGSGLVIVVPKNPSHSSLPYKPAQ